VDNDGESETVFHRERRRHSSYGLLQPPFFLSPIPSSRSLPLLDTHSHVYMCMLHSTGFTARVWIHSFLSSKQTNNTKSL
jgi:hypothetical protein